MMDSSKELIEYIEGIYNSTAKQRAHNIIRGHLRSISSDIEDGIAMFISKALPQDYKLFLDPTIHIDKKGNRPDLLIVDSQDKVAAMIEIKANMGWCRDAGPIIDKINEKDSQFRSKKKLKCEFSTQAAVEVSYEEGVKLYLLSLTDLNCPAQHHESNKLYASSYNISYYNLFTGWYDSLQVKDAEVFISDLVSSIPKNNTLPTPK